MDKYLHTGGSNRAVVHSAKDNRRFERTQSTVEWMKNTAKANDRVILQDSLDEIDRQLEKAIHVTESEKPPTGPAGGLP